MNYMESTELALLVVGLDETADMEELDDVLFTQYGVTLEQFHTVAKALVQFTIPAQAGLSGDWFKGFVYQGAFITKQPTEAP